MSLVEDGEPPYYCAHCEWEMEAELYLAHIGQCLAWHIEAWPIHEASFAPFSPGIPELCGKPHTTPEERDRLFLKLLEARRCL